MNRRVPIAIRLVLLLAVSSILLPFRLSALPSRQIKPTPAAEMLPQAVGICPQFAEGTFRFLDLDVQIEVAGRTDRAGPLVIYWHGTDTTIGSELPRAFGAPAEDELRDMGGLLVAPLMTTGSGRNTTGNGTWYEGDFRAADEVVACALQQHRIDPARIFSLGMSAGGLEVAAFSYSRSSYIASVVTYSGGHLVFAGLDGTESVPRDPTNKFAALIFYGGPQDSYGLSFAEASQAYRDALVRRGHFAPLCNHRAGHSIPPGIGAVAWRFLLDHPYGGISPTLPTGIEQFCQNDGT
jgi:hypothetical protein